MKKFLLLALMVAAPVLAGCCKEQTRYVTAPTGWYGNCPPVAQPVCPPAVQPACPPQSPAYTYPLPTQPVASGNPVVGPWHPYAYNSTGYANTTYSSAAIAAPAPVAAAPGRITYDGPVQVAGAGTVQYYNPYAVVRR